MWTGEGRWKWQLLTRAKYQAAQSSGLILHACFVLLWCCRKYRCLKFSPKPVSFHPAVHKICLMLRSKNKLKHCLFMWCFMEILYHGWCFCYQPQVKTEGLTRCFHNSSHDSQANTSLTDVLFLLLLLFVLILKAWHWQINNLSLGFQMSQQSLSSHADVSAGSDVCNSIAAQREHNAGLWPPGQALHPLISRETWCKATEFKRCQASRTSERGCRCPRCAPLGTRHSKVPKDVPRLTNVSDCFAVSVILFIFLSVYLSLFLLW